MTLINRFLNKHKLKNYAIIEYNNGSGLRICCALNKGRRDYYDFEKNRIVYSWEVTYARRLSIFTTMDIDKFISNEEAQKLANENILWFNSQLKHSKLSKIEHEIMDCEEL